MPTTRRYVLSDAGRERLRAGRTKAVERVDEKGNVTRYESMTEAGDANNILVTSISACCRGVVKRAGGYYWRFAENVSTKS